jgi:N-acyl-D-amino-acid deacylase
MIDILIQGGTVIDGTGAIGRRADVAVGRGRIIDIGRWEAMEAREVIDASGCVVTPGFVDVHSHADWSLPAIPTADSMVQQGITTTVVGQCGVSVAPIADHSKDWARGHQDAFGFELPWEEWSTLRGYLDYLARTGISLNVVPLVGQGMIRAAAVGLGASPASDEQMGVMHRLLEQAMDEGAIGLSAGLIYPPGSYSLTDELIRLAVPAGERGGFFFCHIRGEGSTLLEAISEAIHIGRESGTAVQVCHLKAAGRRNWNLAPCALDLIDQARHEGLDVSADMYTYLAGSTYLKALLPEWAQEGDIDMVLARLRDSSARDEMVAEMKVTGFCSDVEFDTVYVATCSAQPELEGHSIAELADERGISPYEWIFDTLVETRLNVMMVNFLASEDNVRMQLRHPAVMIGTDGFGLPFEGPLAVGKPHPRCFGTYPRLFCRYVREQQVLSLEEAVWKSTGLPARKLRLHERGLVRVGHAADLVVFDPDLITDTATYQEPFQVPTGIHHVLVNGQSVVREGEHTGRRSGVVLEAD